MENNKSTVSERIKKIVDKYVVPEVFKEVVYSFTPICIIKVKNDDPFVAFESMENDFKSIGFKIRFYQLTKKEYSDYELDYDSEFRRFILFFEAEDFKSLRSNKKQKKARIIQIILLILSSSTIYLSAIFYIIYIEPYYGDFGVLTIRTIFSIFSFCLGMFLIVFVHEMGHFYFSRKHNLAVSYPYIIPGPPPLGMFGAFVSIKDDPKTRNQKFDVAIGGIVLGIAISCFLIIIGFLFSYQMDTETYIQNLASFSGDSTTEIARDLNNRINSYNFLFLSLRYLFFDGSIMINLYGFSLPNQIIILHPLAYSGWIGLLLSGLNLIPISFQDGGHLLKAIFPNRFTKLIGLIIGIIIWLILDIEFWTFALLGVSGALRDLSKDQKISTVPNPIIPLTKSRKMVAILLLGFFVLLWPLTFNRLLFGIGF